MKLMDAHLEPETSPSGLLFKIGQRQRQRLFNAFVDFRAQGGGGSTLNVGAGSTLSDGGILSLFDSEERSRIVCSGLQDSVTVAERQKYGRNDGRQLLYGDAEFDWVLCDGLLEHAGGFMRQFELLKELNRVARKGVFVTVPNRWYPLDLHTGLPLLHWLPAPLRRVRRRRHLLDAHDLKKLASLLPGKHQTDVGHVRLAGPKAHFFLMIRKHGLPPGD